MESVKFEFGSSSQYVKLIDDTFGIETRSLLQLLAKNCHKQYGFNYELGSKIEFPEDPALQQVHIARKIIAKEAQLEGLSFFEYVKLLGKRVKNVQ